MTVNYLVLEVSTLQRPCNDESWFTANSQTPGIDIIDWRFRHDTRQMEDTEARSDEGTEVRPNEDVEVRPREDVVTHW